jgi:hypothetical protein
MKKELKQSLQRLRREGLVLCVEPTRGDHWRLHLWNGTFYIMASTASDWRATRNMEADIRRTKTLDRL